MDDVAPRRAVSLVEVRRHRHELEEIGARYGIGNIRVFGSVARGESDEESDLDLLVDVEPDRGLLSLSAFAAEVEDALHVATQVATVRGLKARVRDRVRAEAVAV